jgi:3-oxoacyl-[acyl-carrier protein] reductase
VDAIGFVARLDSEALVANLAQALAAASIVPDILVNNAGMIATADAGIDGASAAMLSGDISMSVDEWHRGLTMNLTSAFLLTRAVIPAMRHNGWGRIVTVSSVSGALMATRGDVAYATAKAALLGMTRALAVDEAHHGITANAVAPGWIATGSQLPDEASEGYRVPLGRSGTAAEVGSAIAWLASPGASYVTGQLITVDGGNSVAEERL